jgi:mannosyltransferase OCH1-like enzyme
MSINIPLNIVSFYHNVNKMPEKMKLNYNKMVSDNPEFNCQLYDVDDALEFIKYYYNIDVVNAFISLKPYAYKSDLFRYCYMYINGGIYIDIKYECVNNFHFINLIDKEYLVSEPIGVQNCLLILKPNNQLIINCIKNIVENAENKIIGSGPLLTGPKLLSEKYKELYNEENKYIHTSLKWKMENHIQKIYLNDNLILKQYPEYREDLLKNSDQPHYNKLYNGGGIYIDL